MNFEYIGWISSLLLILTIATQLKKQYTEKTSTGVSNFLFIGQVLAEVGFIIYSVMIENWIFAATNVVLLVENFVGLYLTLKFKKQ
ncbi:MAG: hypothetical protein H7235_06810 [Bdellovibrionaceae bacterium]|nr:hypothetical protein [Pseudobdellovibrionaceae bacterium]